MRILFATDGSAHSREALELLVRLTFAEPKHAAIVTVVDTAELPGDIGSAPGALANLKRAIADEARRRLREVTDRLESSDWRVKILVREGNAAEQIIDLAGELGADLVLVGSRGLGGLSRYLLGSVSYRVLKHAPCSVLLARPPQEDPDSAGRRATAKDSETRVVLGHDGSPLAEAALDLVFSSGLARTCRIRVVRILPVVPHYRMDIVQTMGELWVRDRSKAKEELESIKARYGMQAVELSTELREASDISDEMLRITQEFGAHLLVVGSKGHGAVSRFLLGSVSSKLAHHADCSVLVVKGALKDRGES